MISDMEFYRIVNYIRINFGVNLIYKRSLIEKKSDEMLKLLNYKNMRELMDFVEKNKSEEINDSMIDAFFTNHTCFMRELRHFDLLKNIIMPKLVKGSDETKKIRIWSAATSSGQEAYSIMMIIQDYLQENQIPREIEMVGTDVSKKMISMALTGEYTKEQLDCLSPEWIKKYFIKKINGDYKVSESIRKSINFQSNNLMSPFSFENKFHFVFIRNVLVYFESGIVREIVDKIADQLILGGYLFIGTTENIEINNEKLLLIEPSVYRRI